MKLRLQLPQRNGEEARRTASSRASCAQKGGARPFAVRGSSRLFNRMRAHRHVSSAEASLREWSTEPDQFLTSTRTSTSAVPDGRIMKLILFITTMR